MEGATSASHVPRPASSIRFLSLIPSSFQTSRCCGGRILAVGKRSHKVASVTHGARRNKRFRTALAVAGPCRGWSEAQPTLPQHLPLHLTRDGRLETGGSFLSSLFEGRETRDVRRGVSFHPSLSKFLLPHDKFLIPNS